MILIFYKYNKWLSIAILIGAIIRILFLLYGAEIYFNRPNIFIDGDTWAWQNCIENLINKGTYTVGGDKGEFSRMPGYSFFMGVFYLISGKDWNIAVIIIGWVQTLLDIYCIYLIYKLSKLIFKNQLTAEISGLLYATYPFIIVWCPVAYAEQFSVFLMLASLLLFIKVADKFSAIYLILCGILLGIASLTRPQLIPLIAILNIVIIINDFKSKQKLLTNLLVISTTFICVFGLWPLRNYLNHDRIIFTKNSEGFLNWQEDVISFMQFTYSVKSEWDPQYSSIVKNTKTTYPKIAYGDKNDSILLERAIYLSKNCGSGFSCKKGYWKDRIYNNEENCNTEISKIFNYLTEKQKQNNPLNFYLWVPLKNLKKAIFKNQLYDSSTKARKAASLLFYYRSFLILIGFFGCIFMMKLEERKLSIICLLFFLSLYLTLCFGTSPFMRNIEIRYFLPADILLLLPTSYLISMLFNNKTKFNSLNH